MTAGSASKEALRSWNYRVLRDAFGNLAIHEVHYDPKGRPVAQTVEPARFGCHAGENVSSVFFNLHRAARNVLELPVLDHTEFSRPLHRREALKGPRRA